MSDLYPTKTRLALLQAIGGDDVFERGGDYFQAISWEGPDRKVTERTLEQIRAGWAEMYQRGTRWIGGAAERKVRPTALGYRLLAEHFPDQWSEVPA